MINNLRLRRHHKNMSDEDLAKNAYSNLANSMKFDREQNDPKIKIKSELKQDPEQDPERDHKQDPERDHDQEFITISELMFLLSHN